MRGRLLDSDGTSAIGGAMMSLLDRDGRQVDRGLTRPSGLYQLAAPAAGSYRVRAERIGYATVHSDFVEVAAGDTVAVDLAGRVEAVSLAGIGVEADRRCRVRPEEGLAVTRVWDEARKALAAAEWTQERGYYRYEMVGVRREMDRENRRVISEDRTRERSYRKTPYVSRPADELVSKGFARLTATESVYWAPDAAVLLSDPFLDSHCFRLRQDEDRAPGLIGLAFEPVPGRFLPDITGTLWLDPATSRLERLDFYYQNLDLPSALLAGPLGGRVEFEALPNGTWIVDSWRIRMPRARRAMNGLTGRVESVLDGITVHGGDVVKVHGNEGTVLEAEAGGTISGVVFDSLRSGLAGARVFVEGMDAEAATDRAGRFEIGGLGPGVYSVNFSHPYMERFSYLPRPFSVEVAEEDGASAQINFIAPSMGRIAAGICRGVERPGDAATIPGSVVQRNDGILVGQVTDSLGGPVGGATVRVVARDFDVRLDSPEDLAVTRTLRAGRTGVAVTTDSEGRYRACWVPVDTRLAVAVLEPGEKVDPAQLQVTYSTTDWLTLSEESVVIRSDEVFRTLDLRVENN